MADIQLTFHPRDTIANTARTTGELTVVGTIFAGAQNALRKQNVGAVGVLTRSGGVIASFAGLGASYQFTLDATSNLRGKDDCYSEAIAGFVAGVISAIPRRSLAFMLGSGAVLSTTMTTFRYTNGFRGASHLAPDDDEEVERREAAKKRRRGPISETLAELGEGRGVYGPGYEERRRQRLLERYGIDVKAAQADA